MMIQTKMSEGGRVVIPIEIRKALGLQEGDAVLWVLADGEARLSARPPALLDSRWATVPACLWPGPAQPRR